MKAVLARLVLAALLPAGVAPVTYDLQTVKDRTTGNYFQGAPTSRDEYLQTCRFTYTVRARTER